MICLPLDFDTIFLVLSSSVWAMVLKVLRRCVMIHPLTMPRRVARRRRRQILKQTSSLLVDMINSSPQFHTPHYKIR